MDNQVYVAMCSPARDMKASYHAWGHSTIVDPNGQILAKAGEGEEIVYANLGEDCANDSNLIVQIHSECKRCDKEFRSPLNEGSSFLMDVLTIDLTCMRMFVRRSRTAKLNSILRRSRLNCIPTPPPFSSPCFRTRLMLLSLSQPKR